MDIKSLMHLQQQFDEQHATAFEWGKQVSEENMDVLKFLMISLTGEVGEMAGIIKKILRGDFSLNSSLPAISEECADIFAYLMKLCNQMNIDLEQAFLRKLEKNRSRFQKYEKQ